MFIFDTGWIKKDVMGTKLLPCSICRRETPHEITRVGFYLTALEMPVFPYKTRHTVICRVCGGGEELTKEQFKKLIDKSGKPEIKEKTTYLYQKSHQEGIKFCRQCGNRIRAEASFCSHCGEKAV